MRRWNGSLARRSRDLVGAAVAALAFGMPMPAAAGGFPGGLKEALGPRFEKAPRAERERRSPPHGRPAAVSWVRRWNQIAIDASGLDHTPVAEGEARTFGEQLGPARSARAMAIVHIAIHDALNAILGEYETFTGIEPGSARRSASLKAAVAQAAHDALVALYPSQAESFGAELALDLEALRDGRAETEGIEVGQQAAAAILALRSGDGSAHAEPQMDVDYLPDDAPGVWRQDPISLIPLALGGHWGAVTPFVLESPDQLRVPPPPALGSDAYTAAFEEAKALGGDGVTTPTVRSAEQTEIGIYWAYDGTPSLCAPPRLYNQIAVQIADQMGSDVVELARLLALANTAMADAGIAIWESKYHYAFWRPVTGIREADPGSGPTGAGDDNPATLGDAAFSPLGAPASNLAGPNFTPPFPAYPSGHAGFGGALFETLRSFYGTDEIPFRFVSDELDGQTVDNKGNVRPLRPRSFDTLSEAEEENGQSRIYLGIHWSFDKTEGIAQGRGVADWVFENAFEPVRGPKQK
jgi:hypothetical protein